MKEKSNVLLDVKNLIKHFPGKPNFLSGKGSYIRAVDDISFVIENAKTLGLVGESGSGKTTTGRLILRLIDATSGSVFFKGKDIFSMSAKETREIRRNMQIIFQDPYSSLNPRMRVFDIIAEPLVINEKLSKKILSEKMAVLTQTVGLKASDLSKYPHEFSGGQRQRIGIARALALTPDLIVCDEPVSALDVSIQGQIINLLMDLQERFGIAFLFITHDLSVVRHISDTIAVMYMGIIVEICDTARLFASPSHPYTQALLSAVPAADPEAVSKRILIPGDISSGDSIPMGCRFHPRCRYKMKICTDTSPVFTYLGDDHFVACHLAEKDTR